MNITTQNIKNTITTKAKELGFFKVGFAKYEVLDEESEKLRKWLDDGKQADMAWIEKGFEKRKDVRQIMPEAKSVISLAFNYYTPFEHDETNPKISRYAWGKDYHKILKKKLKELCDFMTPPQPSPIPPSTHHKRVERDFENVQGHFLEGVLCRVYVDDGPVMEKVWAQKAGIGWMGKHTNIINPDYGSWFFICEIITNIDFENYDTPIEDMCGSCTLCISACPTGAITSEYVVDANRCISYQTIENRGDIPNDINLDGWIFGCDVCQDVCPFNSPKYNHVTSEVGCFPNVALIATPATGMGVEVPVNKQSTPEGSASTPLSATGILPFNSATKEELEAITEEQFSVIFADSPVKRTKYKGWKKNLEKC